MKNIFNLETYTSFLTANGNRYSGVEVSKALNMESFAPAHDSISRCLLEQTFEPSDLWKHVQSQVHLNSSLIVDDTTLDKRWSPNNELVDFHWSGNKHKTIRGISLVNLLATHNDDCIPIDYRVYEGKKDEKKPEKKAADKKAGKGGKDLDPTTMLRVG